MCFYFSNFMGLPDPRWAGIAPKPQYAASRNFQTTHVKIEIDVDPTKKSVSAVCATTLRSLNGKSKLILNAKYFKLLSVKDGKGKALKHSYDGSKIELSVGAETGKEVAVVVSYKLQDPKLGIYFIGPDKHYPNKPVQAWSHSESEDAPYWFPTQDLPNDKSTTEMIITVPANLMAISNGSLVKATDNKKDKTKTFHWRMAKPHSQYLVSFAAGEFEEVKDKWKSIPVIYYCQKGRAADIKRAFGKTPQMIDFFSKKIGLDYPYDKYGQVAVTDFIFGGMEHTTVTTQTDDALHDERAHEEAKYFSEGLCAHELAHQWFGNLITCKDWSHLWLNESFATYFDALYAEHDLGAEEFSYKLYQNGQSYFAEDKDEYRRPIVTNLFRRSNDLVDRHTYQKGSLVLHMLRNALGNGLWWKAVRHYVHKFQNKAVETSDLIAAIEESTGQNMKKFFDHWVFSAGHPEYKVLYHWDAKSKEAVLHISQNQPADTTLFSASMIFEFTTQSGAKSFDELAEQKEQTFRYKLDSEPLMLRIDPENIILKKLEAIKPLSMWIYQLANDPNVIGRITAASEIAKYGTYKEAKILGEAMLRDRFWGVQAEIAALLGQMKNQAAMEFLIKGLSLKHPLARKAVAAALGEFKDPKIIKEIKPLLDDRNSYLVPAEACRTLGKTKDPSAEPILKAMLMRDSWLDAIRAASVDGLAHLHGHEAIETLKKYSEYGWEERPRFAAIKNLAQFGKGRKDVLDKLIELTDDKYTLVQIAAADALGELRDEQAIPTLEKLIKGDRDGRLKRAAEDAIRKIYPWIDSDIETYRAGEEVKRKLEQRDKELAAAKRSAEK